MAELTLLEPPLNTASPGTRILVTALLLGAGAACVPEDASPRRIDLAGLFDEVTLQARERADRAYAPPDLEPSEAAADLSYGQLRGIRFRREAAVWRDDAPFELQFFHPGGAFRTPVAFHLVEGDSTRRLRFDPALFRYGDEVEGRDLSLPPEAGFPGFRVLFPMNDADRFDEVVSFLGASYFRLIGPGHVYGLSSRGIAVNTAGREGEEFPDFVAFWLVKPREGDASLTFFGLLDGPSVTGAYRFDLAPGRSGGTAAAAPGGTAASTPAGPTPPAPRGTVLQVEARLFARADIPRLGVAPLTSMYLHGTFDPGGDDDFRPRVHDSEGLLMQAADGEWIWRPLTNGARLRVTSLRDVDPQGFGLVQRDREFESYMDLEAQYHRRPSEWVDAQGDWGGGGVELVEFPTESEFNDNIVAYWSPDGGMSAGDRSVWRYRLVTFDGRLADAEFPGGGLGGQDLARVVRTATGWDGLPGQADPPPRRWRRVVVDFEGPSLEGLAPGDSLVAVATTSSGTLADLQVIPLPSGGRRATFSLRPAQERGADMRLFLEVDGRPVTETWSYLWEPDGEG